MYTAAGLPGIPREATYNREDFVRLVGSQDVRRRGIRVEDLELIWVETLDDAKAAIAGKPVPRLLASRKWVFNTSYNYGFILRSRRPEVCPDVLYASPLLHRVRQLIYRAARHNKSSRRGTSIIASGPFSELPIGATFLSSFLKLRPVLQCMRFVNNVVDFVIFRTIRSLGTLQWQTRHSKFGKTLTSRGGSASLTSPLKSCVSPYQGINLFHGTRMHMNSESISGFVLSLLFLRNKTSGRRWTTDVKASALGVPS